MSEFVGALFQADEDRPAALSQDVESEALQQWRREQYKLRQKELAAVEGLAAYLTPAFVTLAYQHRTGYYTARDPSAAMVVLPAF